MAKLILVLLCIFPFLILVSTGRVIYLIRIYRKLEIRFSSSPVFPIFGKICLGAFVIFSIWTWLFIFRWIANFGYYGSTGSAIVFAAIGPIWLLIYLGIEIGIAVCFKKKSS